MDGQRRPSILTEVLGDVVCDTLCADEDKNLSVLLADLVQVLDELGALLKVTANLNDLLNIVVCGELHRTDVDLNEIFQEILKRVSISMGNVRSRRLTLASF